MFHVSMGIDITNRPTRTKNGDASWSAPVSGVYLAERMPPCKGETDLTLVGEDNPWVAASPRVDVEESLATLPLVFAPGVMVDEISLLLTEVLGAVG